MNLNTIEIDTNFQTHPKVADYMASLVTGKERVVLEPTPGTGRLVRSLEAKGHLVIQCCILEMDNFFGGTTEFKTFNW